MLTLFKPYGSIQMEKQLFGNLVEVVGVTEPEGPARDAEIREKIRTCDILQADVDLTVDKDLVQGAEKLRAVLCTSIGVDYVNLEDLTEAGILAANNPDFCINAVAEYAIGMMFAVVRCIPKAAFGVANDNWAVRRETGGVELAGKTLGLIGFGRIGREVARMAAALGMRVAAYDAYMNTEAAAAMGVKPATLDEIYARSDVISIHAPLTAETKGMINKDTLAKMKDGTYLVNVARGGIIVEEDLAEAVKSGKLAGVALDVLQEEPPMREHPLLGLVEENILITPHTAWNTREAERRADEHFAEQLKAISAGRLPPSLLNKDVLSHPRAAAWFTGR